MSAKYSLWYVVHESVYCVTLQKHKDTSSSKEVDKWLSSGIYHAASTYREKDEYPAHYVQTFDEQ